MIDFDKSQPSICFLHNYCLSWILEYLCKSTLMIMLSYEDLSCYPSNKTKHVSSILYHFFRHHNNLKHSLTILFDICHVILHLELKQSNHVHVSQSISMMVSFWIILNLFTLVKVSSQRHHIISLFHELSCISVGSQTSESLWSNWVLKHHWFPQCWAGWIYKRKHCCSLLYQIFKWSCQSHCCDLKFFISLSLCHLLLPTVHFS